MSRSPAVAAAALIAAVALTACTSSSGSTSPTKSASATTPAVAGPSASSGDSPAPSSSATTRTTALKTFTKVTGAATTLHFDADFARVLYTHGIDTAATGKTKLVAVANTSNAVLPITAGSAAVYKDATKSTLSLEHGDGGLTVSTDAGAVRVSDLALRLGAKPVISSRIVTVANGNIGPRRPITLFTLQRSASFSTTVAKGVVTVSGLRLYLTSAASKAFDKALGTTVFKGGTKQLVGTVTAVLRGH